MSSNKREVIIEYKGFEKFNAKKKIIIIPYLQREYRWEKDEVEEFMDDLKSLYENYYEDENNDFTPTLGIFYLMPRDAHEQKYEIIEGQQRLTTLLLLIKYLEKNHEIKLDADSEKFKEDIKEIFRNDNIDKSGLLGDAYINIKKWFEKNQQAFASNDKLIEFIWKELYIYEFICNSEKMAIDTFIKLNSRGKPLSFVDLVKAYLIKSKNNLKISDKDIHYYIETTTSTITDEKNKINYKILEDAYGYIIRSYISSTTKTNNKSKFRQIKDYINKDNVKEFFFNEWIEYIKLYKMIKTKSNDNLDQYKWIIDLYDAIVKIEKIEYLPIILRLFLETYIQKKLDEAVMKSAVSNLLRFFLKNVIEFSKEVLDGVKKKFDSKILKYSEIFNYLKQGDNKLDLKLLSLDDFFNKFQLPSTEKLYELYNSFGDLIEGKKDVDSKDKEKFEHMKILLEKYIID